MADAMLGRLAHWLRLLGFDCAYESDIRDESLVRIAIEQRRVILTRDRALSEEWSISGVHLVCAETTFEQLAEVVSCFQLSDRINLFSLCSRCNVALVEARREQVRERVPATVFMRQQRFRRCPQCDRLYWEGSHTDRMRRVIDRMLAST